MKKVAIISLTLISGISVSACGQVKDVPSQVTQVFEAQFESAKKVKWESEDENEWEAEFKQGKLAYSAKFDNKGNWLETEHKIEAENLPEAIKEVLAATYQDFKIKEAEVVESKEYKLAYEVEIESGDKELLVLIDRNGKVIKESKEEEDDNDTKD